MTVAEAAEQLGCKPGLAYKLCALGKLGYSRLGFGRGKIVISARQLDEYSRRCEVVAVPHGFKEPEPRSRRVRVRDRIGEIERNRAARKKPH